MTGTHKSSFGKLINHRIEILYLFLFVIKACAKNSKKMIIFETNNGWPLSSQYVSIYLDMSPCVPASDKFTQL